MVPTSPDPAFKCRLSHCAGGGGSGGGNSDRKKVRTNVKFRHWLKSKDWKLLQVSKGAMADMVVAISAVPENSLQRYVIYVKTGVYKKYVEVSNSKSNIMIIGDSIDVTIISGNRNYVDGWTMVSSATFGVLGQGFIAGDMTFENTTGPQKYQVVAFRSSSDHSVIYRCAIRGYQDTLFSLSLCQFCRESQIIGTVDFIFGGGTVVFQKCQILVRKAESDVTNPTYLGRPWKKNSRMIIMESYLSDAIRLEGWLEWKRSLYLDILFYAEYMNNEPGADLGGRVKWPGYHIIKDSAQVKQFTVARFISGDTWLPSTGVKYKDDLAI
ncbi:unnamed protein product [Fraxinus pennsylvanica]|uniref:Pectinesterase n=1 Tax=Fraxinus pennsylvanica TaxID=56036 RepID=A0AAD2DX79_9LAMI|nr:unnamed protein product [Fraxinus pennsylvanica]